jgi:hypothetical protein
MILLAPSYCANVQTAIQASSAALTEGSGHALSI